MNARNRDTADSLRDVAHDARVRMDENLGAHLDLMKKGFNDFFDTMQDIRTSVFKQD